MTVTRKEKKKKTRKEKKKMEVPGVVSNANVVYVGRGLHVGDHGAVDPVPDLDRLQVRAQHALFSSLRDQRYGWTKNKIDVKKTFITGEAYIATRAKHVA